MLAKTVRHFLPGLPAAFNALPDARDPDKTVCPKRGLVWFGILFIENDDPRGPRQDCELKAFGRLRLVPPFLSPFPAAPRHSAALDLLHRACFLAGLC